eukprot:TRINITY_DN8890_c0_g1_i1.p1 TRINITY_DN8890_c0_g1~~TRINITY_DN8890_c0_g1_i1.p1  ORF type:complete len:300 (-),score=53.84 TRINITY_DN8890_c0_g1_i1:121-900(-)
MSNRSRKAVIREKKKHRRALSIQRELQRQLLQKQPQQQQGTDSTSRGLLTTQKTFAEWEANVGNTVKHLDDLDFRGFLRWCQAILFEWEKVDLSRAANIARKALALSTDGLDANDPRSILLRTFLIDCLERLQIKTPQNESNKEKLRSEVKRLLCEIYEPTEGNIGAANELRYGRLLVESGEHEEAQKVLLKLYERRKRDNSTDNKESRDSTDETEQVVAAGILLHRTFGDTHVSATDYQALLKTQQQQQPNRIPTRVL